MRGLATGTRPRDLVWWMQSISRPTQALLDVLVLIVAFGLAYLLRFDFALSPLQQRRALLQLPLVVGLQVLAFAIWGVYSFIWRYVGLAETRAFLGGALSAAVPLLLLRMGLPDSLAEWRVPASVVVTNAVLGFGGALGLRVLRRVLFERYERQGEPGRDGVRTRRDPHAPRRCGTGGDPRGEGDPGPGRPEDRRPRVRRRRPAEARVGRPRYSRRREDDGHPLPSREARDRRRHHHHRERLAERHPSHRGDLRGLRCQAADHSGALRDPRRARAREPDSRCRDRGPSREGGRPPRRRGNPEVPGGPAGARLGGRRVDRRGAGETGGSLLSAGGPARGANGVRALQDRRGDGTALPRPSAAFRSSSTSRTERG